ncbi:hypothetical protein PITCH_A1420004 [uncultured Desulfobacterium sp.]|uniref:Uncharacterized protein n=1 Tax=uncultured Desulfobacterium sp. TaxID=201089 RepID=A0A445MT26_9BACT|nr:hypothetical protein PITCH_A1420004 [uncultured Desulfobacterium sp.]
MIVDLKSTPHKTPRLIVEGGLVLSISIQVLTRNVQLVTRNPQPVNTFTFLA